MKLLSLIPVNFCPVFFGLSFRRKAPDYAVHRLVVVVNMYLSRLNLSKSLIECLVEALRLPCLVKATIALLDEPRILHLNVPLFVHDLSDLIAHRFSHFLSNVI